MKIEGKGNDDGRWQKEQNQPITCKILPFDVCVGSLGIVVDVTQHEARGGGFPIVYPPPRNVVFKRQANCFMRSPHGVQNPHE